MKMNFIILGSHTERVFALRVGMEQCYLLINFKLTLSLIVFLFFKQLFLHFIFQQITHTVIICFSPVVGAVVACRDGVKDTFLPKSAS